MTDTTEPTDTTGTTGTTDDVALDDPGQLYYVVPGKVLARLLFSLTKAAAGLSVLADDDEISRMSAALAGAEMDRLIAAGAVIARRAPTS